MLRVGILLLTLVIGMLPVFGAIQSQTALAAEVTVATGSDLYPCTRDGLAAAIEAAAAGAPRRVIFDCEDPTISFVGKDPISVDGITVEINGENGDGEQIVLDGGGETDFLSIGHDADLTVRNMTLQNGFAQSAGAISVFEGDLTVHRSTFVNNRAEYDGGAIAGSIFAGLITVTESTFEGNVAGLGERVPTFGGYGGAISTARSPAVVERSTFIDNEAYAGGALNIDGSLTVRQSRFDGNQAVTGVGGAILAGDTFPDDGVTGLRLITRSTFINNHSADNGGAVYAARGTPEIRSSTFINNTAPDYGSAIAMTVGTGRAMLRWSTIVQPAGTSQAFTTARDAHLQGMIFAGAGDHCEIPSGVSSAEITDEYSLSNNTSCDLQGTGSEQNVAGLGLGTISPAEVNGVIQSYYPLETGSPAIDAGGTTCPAIDQLGNARAVNDACDIGAIEFGSAPPTSNTPPVIETTSVSTPALEGQPVMVTVAASDVDDDPLRYAIDCTNDGDFEIEGVASNQLSCTYSDNGDYEGRVAVSDGINAVEDTFNVQVTDSVDPVDLCANRWNGSLRMPADSCTGSETLVHVPSEPTVIICANAWNGDARYSPSRACNSSELRHEATGEDNIPICVNRWNGSLRVSETCSGSEWSDAI